MPKFYCLYSEIGLDKTVEAKDHQEAYKKYLNEVPLKAESVFVRKGFFGLFEEFREHIDVFTEQKRKAKIEKERALAEKQRLEDIDNAKEGNEFLINKTDDGYFKLEIKEKIHLQLYLEYLIEESGKRILYDEEIQYLKLWLDFKDRELGQTLLAQAEAKKPAAERGKSQLAQTITMGIVAGNMVKSQQLRELKELNESVDEIAEDVEDVSEGFEM